MTERTYGDMAREAQSHRQCLALERIADALETLARIEQAREAERAESRGDDDGGPHGGPR